MGIINASAIPHDVETSKVGGREWDSLTPEEKKLSCRAMEAYAGMVDSIDVNVGKVVDYLKKSGEYDNTFIVFMSDNGAEGAALEAVPVMGDNILQAIHQYYDNSYENLGAWNSFSWLGPLWAQASTAPSRLFKCYPSEGGILVPCVVKPPINKMPCAPPKGSLNRSFSTVMDFLPTFLDLAGISLPPASAKERSAALYDAKDVTTRKMTTFRGKDVHAVRGRSWMPYFGRGEKEEEDETWAIYSSQEPVGWELFARGALRKGEWKIVHIDKKHGGVGEGDTGWELFNIARDPGETEDLARAEPEKYKELLAHWDEYVVDCGIVWGDFASAPGFRKDEAPDYWQDELELQSSWMVAKGGETVQ
ncbi:uncharacterized protein LTR77_010289 [Saxophila tyrrhenica]|uniref:Sulfatase N-terminal domain-containing protein n=1 Tax=Saxophila tyrrhenica TaxID=1690608 RepID=A0AAV9NWN1_9PEZI|nr:hypothetical protein LTR77_010289 [Saxophila tyrrhenica]